MAIEVNIHEAKTHLSRLLQRVMGGEEIVICRAGRPIARLVPYSQADGPRIPGRYAGQVWIADDFDDEQDMVELFEGVDAGRVKRGE